MSTNPSRFSRTLRALLPVVAILAPASILAVLGLRAYSAEALLLRQRFERDQVGIVRLVGRRLADEARRALSDLEARCRNRAPDDELESRFVSAHPLARHILLVRDDRLVYPVVPETAERGRLDRPLDGSRYLVSDLDVQQYIARLKRQRWRSRLISRGLREEYRGRRKQALRIYRALAKGDSQAAPQALLGLARLYRRVAGGSPGKAAGDPGEPARQAFRALRKRFGGRVDGEGIDYALLADVGLAELGSVDDLLGLHRRLVSRRYRSTETVRHFYLRWTVQLVRDRAPHSVELARLEQQTARLFAAERFGRRLLRLGPAELSQMARGKLRSVALDQRTVLVLQRSGETVIGYALAEGVLRSRLAEQQRELVTTAEGMRLALRRAGEIELFSREQPFYRAPLAPPLNYWTLIAERSANDPLGAMQRRGELKQLAVVVALLVLLASGLFFTYRGVRREYDLAQLKSDFVSTVSHELKTPLTAIRMYAEMLQEGIADSSAARDRYQKVIIRESERLGQLITNVLDFSRVERGTRRYELVAADFAELAREAVETFRRLSDGGVVKVHFEPPDDLPPVRADREAAVTSLLNLLSNAAKYSRERPAIEVRFDRPTDRPGFVGVTVIDGGIGIPLLEQKRIFEDFYRAPGAREAGVEGTGLGLSLVRRHMEACGGSVTVESEQGQGSAFTLWFPRAAERPPTGRQRIAQKSNVRNVTGPHRRISAEIKVSESQDVKDGDAVDADAVDGDVRG